jgi:hypothetical protein
MAFLSAMAIGALLSGDPAAAQSGSGPMTRYQISSYSGPTPQGVHHGCYVVDTLTGQLWHARLGGPPEKVSAKLP